MKEITISYSKWMKYRTQFKKWHKENAGFEYTNIRQSDYSIMVTSWIRLFGNEKPFERMAIDMKTKSRPYGGILCCYIWEPNINYLKNKIKNAPRINPFGL